MKSFAVFGGSFNPVGLHHRAMAEMLTKHFHQVIVVPCGPRPDKLTTNDIAPVHRAAMVDMTFRGLKNVIVDLFDLEEATFTPTHVLDGRYAQLGSIWHVVGSDLVEGGAKGESVIQKHWKKGLTLWKELQFAVVKRPGYEIDSTDLPPNSEVFECDYNSASTLIREKVFKRENIGDYVVPEVEQYIERHGLYRGRHVQGTSLMEAPKPRLKFVFDKANGRSVNIREKLDQFAVSRKPNMIAVIGGDGMMLQAIRKYWRERLPFVGINTGHLGMLLNKPSLADKKTFPPAEFVVSHCPMLYAEIIGDGKYEQKLAFNDCWVERANSQSAWLEVSINGKVRIPKLICDGALAATAAGSSAYARAMGAPLLIDTPSIVLVGNNVIDPIGWKFAVLTSNSVIQMKALDPVKRPIRAMIDGVDAGLVREIRIRHSRVAAAELCFAPDNDLAEKLNKLQFPV